MKADGLGNMPQWHPALDQLAGRPHLFRIGSLSVNASRMEISEIDDVLRRYRAAIARIGNLRAFTRATISALRFTRSTCRVPIRGLRPRVSFILGCSDTIPSWKDGVSVHEGAGDCTIDADRPSARSVGGPEAEVHLVNMEPRERTQNLDPTVLTTSRQDSHGWRATTASGCRAWSRSHRSPQPVPSPRRPSSRTS